MNRRALLATLAAAALPLPAFAAKAEMGLFVHAQPRPLPTLDIRDGEGRAAGPEQWRGRPALVNLWASWCLPCVAELPALDRLAARMAGRAHVVALCLDRAGAVSAVNTYARLGIRTLAVRIDHHRQAGEAWGAPVLPTTLLLDPQGLERARFVGAAEWDSAAGVALLLALGEGRPLAGLAPPPPVKRPATAP
ncbi:TlpA disulfide reductase family protein [Magnetospirillum sp. UT-4]|uniref:TlpA family protein disulfide reductase n=1 Tax=Magnetospirillum sp. UT-4 TaxID=2681467 RepID=UPI0013855DFC|nr:TlpA disulfide reductase family protein [Magnetospirillum sp. UT-4]CAA7626593.1 Thioredoxin, thioldisulfide interchange protein [Magnetospirillum sp. UT-4]